MAAPAPLAAGIQSHSMLPLRRHRPSWVVRAAYISAKRPVQLPLTMDRHAAEVTSKLPCETETGRTGLLVGLANQVAATWRSRNRQPARRRRRSDQFRSAPPTRPAGWPIHLQASQPLLPTALYRMVRVDVQGWADAGWRRRRLRPFQRQQRAAPGPSKKDGYEHGVILKEPL